MLRLTYGSPLTLALLLLCGNPASIEAQSGDTKVTVKDGSIVLHADGLDAGQTWNPTKYELRHLIGAGVLGAVQITDGGASQCSGSSLCGIDATTAWSIKVTYNGSNLTLSSISTNKGLHLKFSHKMSWDKWQKTGNPDERIFSPNDGKHIGRILVNGATTSLCKGQGACQIDLDYKY
jgi:hypothetical protein